MANHQRIGEISNAHAGREFEREANEYFLRVESLALTSDFNVDIGVGTSKKADGFDLGSKNPHVLIECKSHNWTETGNMPSAKVTVCSSGRTSSRKETLAKYQKASPSLSTIQNQATHAIKG